MDGSGAERWQVVRNGNNYSAVGLEACADRLTIKVGPSWRNNEWRQRRFRSIGAGGAKRQANRQLLVKVSKPLSAIMHRSFQYTTNDQLAANSSALQTMHADKSTVQHCQY